MRQDNYYPLTAPKHRAELCSWCDSRATHNLGTNDACCVVHHTVYFAVPTEAGA